MQSRIQLIFSLAIIACVACMALALPVEEPKVKNPRLGGAKIIPQHVRRDIQSVDIDLSGSSADATPVVAAAPTDTQAAPSSIGTIATDEITTTGNHTWWTTEEALANNNGSTDYQFNMTLAETNPLNDGQAKMEEQNKKAKKDAKKAEKAEKEAKKNETSTDSNSD